MTDALRDWLRPSSLVAMLLGGLLSFPLLLLGDDALHAIEDYLRPVSRARVLGVTRSGDEPHLSMAVTRLRGECKVLGGYAWAVSPEGYALKLNAERVDGQPVGDVPAGTEVRVGEWRIWPVRGTTRIRLHAHYDCGGRLVSTLLAEVSVWRCSTTPRSASSRAAHTRSATAATASTCARWTRCWPGSVLAG